MTDAIAASQQDYRLDYGIGTSCAADAGTHCEMEQRVGRGQVLACLVKTFSKLRGAPLFLGCLWLPLAAYFTALVLPCGCHVTLLLPARGARTPAPTHPRASTACLPPSCRPPAGACQTELSRGVRLALWGFKPGQPLTKACDADVQVCCRACCCAALRCGVLRCAAWCESPARLWPPPS